MTPNPYAVLNQKLYFVQRQKEALNAELNSDAFNRKAQALAARSALIWSLYSVYSGLCALVCERYKEPYQFTMTLSQVRERLLAQDVVSPELENMAEVMNTSNNWLSFLLTSVDALAGCQELVQLAHKDQSQAAALSLTASQSELLDEQDIDKLSAVEQGLRDLIILSKDLMDEF